MVSSKKIKREFYGKGLPDVAPRGLSGCFISLDGAEGSGCSTQARLLRETFERAGYPTMQIGIGQSEFIGHELQEVLKTSFLCPYTLNLFKATEIADQVENRVIPALKAGFVVIADRYVITSMASGAVRGIPQSWLSEVYGFALRPDLSILLDATSAQLAQRSFSKSGSLGFWESGRDCVVASDVYEGFLSYQDQQRKFLRRIGSMCKAQIIRADTDIEVVNTMILRLVDKVFDHLHRLTLGI